MTHVPTYVDVSARPTLRLHGPEALDLMQRISTNDVRSLTVGSVIGTILTTDKGRIRDVVSLLRVAEAELLLFGTIGPQSELSGWIERFVIMEELTLSDATNEFFRFELLWHPEPAQGGPGGSLQKVELIPGGAGTAWRFSDPATSGKALQLVGDKRLEAHARQYLEKEGFRAATEDSLRDFCVYYGVPIPGRELSVEYNPHEVGLLDLVSFTKGCYIGQEVVARLDTYKKVQRRLVSLELSEKPAKLPARLASGAEEVGSLTSSIFSDELANWIGTAYVRPAFLEHAAPATYAGERREGVAKLRRV